MPLRSCLNPPSLWTQSDITSNMICAGHMTGYKSPCNGDSGGPLIIPKESDAIVLGVFSFGVKRGIYKKRCK